MKQMFVISGNNEIHNVRKRNGFRNVPQFRSPHYLSIKPSICLSVFGMLLVNICGFDDLSFYLTNISSSPPSKYMHIVLSLSTLMFYRMMAYTLTILLCLQGIMITHPGTDYDVCWLTAWKTQPVCICCLKGQIPQSPPTYLYLLNASSSSLDHHRLLSKQTRERTLCKDIRDTCLQDPDRMAISFVISSQSQNWAFIRSSMKASIMVAYPGTSHGMSCLI